MSWQHLNQPYVAGRLENVVLVLRGWMAPRERERDKYYTYPAPGLIHPHRIPLEPSKEAGGESKERRSPRLFRRVETKANETF